MLIISNMIYHIWLGNKVYIPFALSLVWVIFVGIQSLNSIFVHFIKWSGQN